MFKLNFKKVCLMQPTFLPWLGYLALIHDADEFVFLDDFQLVRQSFGHRNKLLIGGNEHMVTLPLAAESSHTDSYMNTRPAPNPQFLKKFMRSLEQSYSFSPWLVNVMDKLETLFQTHKDTSLADMNIDFIQWVCEFCGIDGRFSRSSEVRSEGKRSQRVANLLKAYEADIYLSPRGAFDYMVEDGIFPLPDCEVVFQNFTPLRYPQKKVNDFVSHLSVVDTILQIGPEETKKNIVQAAGQYKTWAEMMEESK